MDNDELFVDGNNLPRHLSKQEVYDLLEKIKQGNEKAREKLIEHNIRLVLYEVTKRFKLVEYDKKDLVSIGIIGLMKATNTFDISKKVEFATYAARCIDNEILMFLRKIKRDQNLDSLDTTIRYDKNGNELKIKDILSDKIDIIKEYTDNETNRIIKEIIKELPDRDRKIIMLHFGFYNNKIYTQEEIADILSISQSYVSRLIPKIVKRLGEKFEQEGIVELRRGQQQNRKVNLKKERKNEMSRKVRTIYEYFDSYTKEQVDIMLAKLSEEEIELITLRYGNDLNNPVVRKLNKEEMNKFYGSLMPKMKRLLADPNKEIKSRKKRTTTSTNIKLANRHKNEETVKKQESEIIYKKNSVESMTKEDYLKILEALRTPYFASLIKLYSPKDAMVAFLKLGYVDGKCFSTTAISDFLGIEQQDVIDTTRKVLFTYKERINQIIDSAIQIVGEETETPFISRKIK